MTTKDRERVRYRNIETRVLEKESVHEGSRRMCLRVLMLEEREREREREKATKQSGHGSNYFMFLFGLNVL